MLEKRNYIPWESRFRRFLDNKLEEGERMWHSINKGPYERPMIPDPDDTTQQIIEPLSKMTEINKKQYTVDVRGMNYLLQIYNSVDTCKNAKEMWERIKSKGKRIARIFIDYEEDYQGELQGDSQEDKLTTAMMLLARAITQKFSTPTNNRLRTSSNTRHQAVIQDGRVDIQTKNAGYGGNGNRNAGRQNRNQAFNAGNGNEESNQVVQRVLRTESNPGKPNFQCYKCNEKGHYARGFQKPRVRDVKYFREQMLLAMKDEAESNLNAEENDFMLDNSFGDDTLEELTAAVIMMARIQPVDDNVVTEPYYDAKAVSEVNASHKVHEQANHVKRKTIIHTYDDDQIDSNIIFDDPYVENNGGTYEHDLNAHDEYHAI
ncbi:retrovirus-related pol polyprotein from transposon TNT 1-94 [Tanacetum coccineum]